MNTIQAFKHVISQRDCHERTGMSYSIISKYRRWAEGKEDGKKPTIDKMEEIIAAYGAVVVQDKIWKV